jgi:Xaa-Pro aminopeptidase
VRLASRIAFLAPLALASVAPLGAQIAVEEFAARRAALLNIVGEGVTLVLGSGTPVPEFLPYQQSRPFYYLTGFREPDAALVLVRRGGEDRAWIFVPPKDPSREVWTGPRLGAAAARAALGIEGRSGQELRAVLDSLLSAGTSLNVAGDLETENNATTPHQQFVESLRARHATLQVSDVTGAVATLRGRKSPAELQQLRTAAGISARGHLAAMRMAVPGIAEFELQAAAEYQWRLEGADGPGYGSILASGSNATSLHYQTNDRISVAGDVVVMDMAASFDGYTADITRTIPVSGRFSAPQSEIYQVVLDAQKAAERQIRVGAPARAMTDSSNAVLVAGLVRLGLIEAAGATYDCGPATRPRQCSQLGLYYMHGLGHGIGLDVHDPEQYYQSATIGVGSAFTLEPGIYVRVGVLQLIPDSPRNRALIARLAPAAERYSGIGIRIEDDYLVTADGAERVSAEVPREMSEVEAVLALPRAARVPGAADRFRRSRSGR